MVITASKIKHKTILIIDDHPLVRSGIKQYLKKISQYSVVEEAENPEQAVQMTETYLPDIILLDLCFRNCDAGFKLIPILKQIAPHSQILVISMYDDVQRVKQSLQLGAHGYLLKTEPPGNLLKALEKIEKKHIYLSHEMSSRLIDQESTISENQAKFDKVKQLSSRELEVFIQIATGITTREVAENLFISKKTVESHRINIKRKLQLNTYNELLKFAVEWTASIIQ